MIRGRFNQRGIALGPLLFIIAILAVIAAVIAATTNQFTATTTTPSASTMAATIIQESEQVQSAVQMLMANGCTETQLNFYVAGYLGATAGAPSDGHCNIFDPRGANMVYVPMPAAACNPTGSCIWNPSDANIIPGIGTGGAQPIWIAYYVTPAVCDQINAQLGRTTNTTSSAITGAEYLGTFPGSTTLNAVYTGVMAACLEQTATIRVFYRVLWTR